MRNPAFFLVRTLRILGIAGLLSLVAACASVGRPMDSGRSPVVAATRIAPVTDPAPIVSGTMRPYQIRGRTYRPEEQPTYDVVGMASWYGDQFNGRPTATGERFNMHALTAAHKTLPLPGLIEVTNLANGRVVVLRVNDRGPFVDDRILDLSRGAAEALDMLNRGVGEVRVRYLGRAPRLGGGQVIQMAEAPPPPPSPAPPPPAVAQPVVARTLWLQVAAYPDPASARAVAGRVGSTAQVQAATNQQSFRVIQGPWTDANAAESARQGALAQGYADARLIPGG